MMQDGDLTDLQSRWSCLHPWNSGNTCSITYTLADPLTIEGFKIGEISNERCSSRLTSPASPFFSTFIVIVDCQRLYVCVVHPGWSIRHIRRLAHILSHKYELHLVTGAQAWVGGGSEVSYLSKSPMNQPYIILAFLIKKAF